MHDFQLSALKVEEVIERDKGLKALHPGTNSSMSSYYTVRVKKVSKMALRSPVN